MALSLAGIVLFIDNYIPTIYKHSFFQWLNALSKISQRVDCITFLQRSVNIALQRTYEQFAARKAAYAIHAGYAGVSICSKALEGQVLVMGREMINTQALSGSEKLHRLIVQASCCVFRNWMRENSCYK